MKRIIAAAALICIALVFLLEPLGLAWMSDNGMSSPIDITSNVHKSYFESGDGTKDLIVDEETGEVISGPYEIKYPLQLYYFAWLQYLGYFNTPKLDKNGNEMKDENGNVITDTVYFRVSANLDMDYIDEITGEHYAYVLPPIGTTNQPFLGNFDGGGFTITDLVIENVYDNYLEPPDEAESDFGGVEIIGFFGVIGELAEGDYSYDTQANEVKNVVLENLTVKTQTDNALIGLVAGYVNGIVDCVGVVGSKVNIKQGTTSLSYTENMSDYSLIGYCTETYKDSVYVMDVMLNNPGISDKYTVVPEIGGEGENTGWGGSVKMLDIYTWLTDVKNAAPTVNNGYYTERVDVVNLLKKTVTVDFTTASEKTYSANLATGEPFGSFVFTTNSNVNYVNFVSGGQKVTQFKYAYTENDVALYYITDGTNYLSFDGTNIINSTSQADATKWYVSNGTSGGVISAVVNGSVYYLTITDGSIAVIADVNADPSNLPSWTVSGNTYSLNDQKIVCENGNWIIDNSFKIASGSNYLTNNGTNDLRAATKNEACSWKITATDNGYAITTIIDNTTYYLSYTQQNNGWQTTYSNLSLSTNVADAWHFENNRLYLGTQNNWFSSAYYLRYENGDWTLSTTNTTLTFESTTNANVDINSSGTTAKEIICQESAYIDNSIENSYYNENGDKVPVTNTNAGITYFPLSTTVSVSANKFEISTNNTGYIIGSEWDTTTKQQQDGNTSNLRISQYAYTNNYMNMTLAQAIKPYAISYKTSNAFVELTSSTDVDYLKSKGLVKYADCYQEYYGSVQTACNGLHFMDAPIMKENVTKIDAYLKGEWKYGYEVPTNCINFNLYERGFINAFAGTYYSQGGGNDSFFSLYEVFRINYKPDDPEYDPDKQYKITDIKEIQTIYGVLKNRTDNEKKEIDTSKAYIYKYTDGTYKNTDGTISNAFPDTGELVYDEIFNCRWLTHTDEFNGWSDNRAFYFEVPVNAGEYAIGSTQGRTGAYLVYLDLAANAQLIERTKEYEEIYENKAAGDIPGGVEILEKNENGYDADNDGKIDVDPTGSAFPSINKGTSGEITFDKDGNTVTHSATGGTTAEYIGTDAELKDGNGNLMTVPFVETKIERTTYRDLNLVTGVYMVTIITKTTVTKEDGTKTVKYTKQVTATDADGNVIEKQTYAAKEVSEADAVPDTEDTGTNDAEKVTAGNKLIDLAFAYGQKVNVTVTYLYTPATKGEDGTVTKPATYLITIVNKGAEDVDVKAILTADAVSSGITFIISDGTTETTLNNNANAQTVTIKGTGATEGGEGTDTPENGEGTEGGEDPAA